MKIKVFCLFIFLILLIKFSSSQTFTKVGCDLPYHTTALNTYDNLLLHSGLDSICGVSLFDIGVWNNTNWSGIHYNDPVDGSAPILSFCTFQNQLIVGGGLYYMGNIRVNGIARWNGSDWFPLGTGMNTNHPAEQITDLIEYKGELYAAGCIIEINGLKNVNNIARWDGTTWKRVGTGLQGSLAEVYSMAIYKNELYVGGRFLDAGGVTAYNIAKWNGNTWSSVGLGTNSDILTMRVDTLSDLLYVGGDFDVVNGNISANYIASWNGTSWNSLGAKLFHIDVSALEMYHGYLYAGGYSEKMQVNFARWDGNNWDSLLGLNGNVTSLQTYKNKLYLGGDFTMIGNDSIQYLASYYSADSVAIGIDNSKRKDNISLYPNPSSYHLKIKSSEEFKYYEIYTLLSKQVQIGEIINQEINTSELLPGMYILKVLNKAGQVIQQRFVKE